MSIKRALCTLHNVYNVSSLFAVDAERRERTLFYLILNECTHVHIGICIENSSHSAS